MGLSERVDLEWQVLWCRKDGKSAIAPASDEDNARSFARALRDSGMFTVSIESRIVGPWLKRQL